MNNRLIALLLALPVALVTPACSKAPAAESQGSPADVKNAGGAEVKKIDDAAAKEIYESRCSACHGVSGKGDGPGSAALNPKPRNFTDAAWNKAISDDNLRKVIIYGGAAVGKSPMMPASPDLDSKPEVVDGLIKKVRAFGG